jgi:sulfide:quinone oxidoreductase
MVILGAGTGGTMMAAKMRRALDADEWTITIVDQDNRHIYQPGLLFIPFSVYRARDVVKPRSRYIPLGVNLIISKIEVIEPEESRVRLKDGTLLEYDILIIATGSRIVPEETEGMVGPGWQKNIFDFYTLEGAVELQKALDRWEGGRVVLNVVEMPIKCPIAPLEFIFLADEFFTEQGTRDATEIVYATPLDGAFTRPRASEMLGGIIEKKNIKTETLFSAGEVDGEKRVLSSWDSREIEYDLLVTIPVHMGSETIIRSDMGDELGFLPTNPNTLQHVDFENVFVIGDATDLPTSKAGSVAHFEGEVLEENLLRYIDGRPLCDEFDGHPGKFPVPGLGPLDLLRESEVNHWGKMAFRWIYWNMLLKGSEIPGIESRMSMAGKWS